MLHMNSLRIYMYGKSERLACKMRVPMVICPCGELLDLVSVRHLMTMEVEDIDTCKGTDPVKGYLYTEGSMNNYLYGSSEAFPDTTAGYLADTLACSMNYL